MPSIYLVSNIFDVAPATPTPFNISAFFDDGNIEEADTTETSDIGCYDPNGDILLTTALAMSPSPFPEGTAIIADSLGPAFVEEVPTETIPIKSEADEKSPMKQKHSEQLSMNPSPKKHPAIHNMSSITPTPATHTTTAITSTFTTPPASPQIKTIEEDVFA
ncbi:hypothetical protein BS47DRAFT_1367247 [Hydnum rufescens UP504]|uniref:Uncharacterized protein n=1 Tax=Hydnum rufescens UP504 TaxID=1448309 RepID=A0A9P6AIV5_9AGAM|nr:hypothetical protein BS47DRAFT_1367247 [Hydnum rufescens UP504]